MERIVYTNRFRIVDTLVSKVLTLNTIEDRNGVLRYVAGFDKYSDAEESMKIYAAACGQPISRYRIVSYADKDRRTIKTLTEEQKLDLNQRGYKRLFNGKGLQYNTFTPKREENKYNPSGFYGREVYMYQSTERNKGISLVHKLKDKKGINTGEDIITSHRIQNLTNDGAMSLTNGIVTSLLKKKFADRKSLRTHLKSCGYSCRQTDRIIYQYYETLNSK